MNTYAHSRIPDAARWLGLGGLIPFAALAVAALLDGGRAILWTQALMAYGAIILSFVGALHWAFAMTVDGLSDAERSGRFVWSVMPPLIGWVALITMAFQPLTAVAMLIVGFWIHYLQDRILARRAALPAWYLPLRFGLTTVASLCILVGGLTVV